MKRCCCCSLRTGSLVIGILNIVGAFLGIVFWFAFLFAIMPLLTERITTVRNEISLRKTVLEDPSNSPTDQELLTISQLSDAEIKLNDALHKLDSYDEINKHYFTPLYIIMCVAHLSFASALVHGIRKKSSCLIRSWIIYYASMTVLSMFISVIYYLYMSVSFTSGTIFSIIFGYVFGLAIAFLMLKVVNDYSKEMNQQPFVKQRV